jgi:anti-sigma28 factor (negative regulator of flagellin synthesis)
MNAAQSPQGASRISNPSTTSPVSGGQSRSSASPVDQLDISSTARAASATESSSPSTVGGDMRLDKIADLRRQIASGTYDTPERFEAALGKMLDDIG